MSEVGRETVRANIGAYLDGLGIPRENTSVLSHSIMNALDILAQKRSDYGSANINQTGTYGVTVRMVDKVARLHHLMTKEDPTFFESIEDTATDLINYALILLVLMEGSDW